jgi:hypothetical protein
MAEVRARLSPFPFFGAGSTFLKGPSYGEKYSSTTNLPAQAQNRLKSPAI